MRVGSVSPPSHRRWLAAALIRPWTCIGATAKLSPLTTSEAFTQIPALTGQCEWGYRLTLTRLIIDALRYLMAISTTTASFDRVSCLNKDPHVARVDDFKNCKKSDKITRDKTAEGFILHWFICSLSEVKSTIKLLSSHLAGMCSEG